MTARSKIVYEIYLELGPARTLRKAAELSGSNYRTVQGWSGRYEWVRLCAEADHRQIKESLAGRTVIRERATQKMIDGMAAAADVLLEIALDRSVLPVLDRHGGHMRGPDNDDGTPGALLWKPQIKASTRANCAEKVLGLGGLVQPKRIVVEDSSGEELDNATAAMEGMHPDDLDEWMGIIRRRNKARDDGDE